MAKRSGKENLRVDLISLSLNSTIDVMFVSAYPVDMLGEDAGEGQGDHGAHVAAAEGHRGQPASLEGRRPPLYVWTK